MFIYTNANGQDVACHGVADMRKADGFATNYAPRIVFDEEGALVGVQGGELELTKSFSVIANLKKQAAEEVLRKSQKQTATLRKSFEPARPLHRTASLANKEGFTRLLNELDTMRRDQNQFMKARAWS